LQSGEADPQLKVDTVWNICIIVAASNNDVLYIIVDPGGLRPPLLIAPQHEGRQMVQLTSMPLDSIVMAMATILMFSILIAALAWGVHQSG
jgi:hypothetical protein